MDVGEKFADLPCPSDESLAISFLHLEVCGKVLPHGAQHQHRATLVGFAQQGNQFRPWPREIDVVDFHARFQSGVKLQQADHFGAAGAVESLTLIGEILPDEIQSITFHALYFCGKLAGRKKKAAAAPHLKIMKAQDKNRNWPGGRRFVVAIILGQVGNDKRFPPNIPAGRNPSCPYHEFPDRPLDIGRNQV
jgi:hypothetical protein